jgi:hypothetical protein
MAADWPRFEEFYSSPIKLWHFSAKGTIVVGVQFSEYANHLRVFSVIEPYL